jgi:hypothetical protein
MMIHDDPVVFTAPTRNRAAWFAHTRGELVALASFYNCNTHGKESMSGCQTYTLTDAVKVSLDTHRCT